MKYCPECGAKLEEKHGENRKKTDGTYKRCRYLTYAGVLAIIAASICLVTGVMGMMIYSHGEYHEEYQPASYISTKQYENPIEINKCDVKPVKINCCEPPVRHYRGEFIDRYYTLQPLHLIASIVQFLGFFFGLISGVFILIKKMFPLVIIGLATLMGAAILVAALNIIAFIILGLPMLVMSIISMVFTCIQKKDFTS